MSCLFVDRPEFADTELFELTTNGNNNGLPYFYKDLTACQIIPHRHTYLQMVYIRRGQLTHVSGSHLNELRCGDLLLMPPYTPHYFIPDPEHSFELAEFEFSAEFIDSGLADGVPYDDNRVLSWLERYTDGHSFPLVSLTGSLRFEVENVLTEIGREYNERKTGSDAVIHGLACKLITLQRRAIEQEGSEQGRELLYERHREVLIRSLDFIRENYTRDITVQDAANVAIMSPSYYRQYFKLLTKKTFTEYLNGLRVAHSITLIRQNPRMKIVDICYASGFSNISHFNRTFLKITGVTPKAFRSHSASWENENSGI